MKEVNEIRMKDVSDGKSSGKKMEVFVAPPADDIDSDHTINGDKVIAFINAVGDLGKILNAVNIIEIKDAFIMGKQCERVDRVIDVKKKWQETLEVIQEAWKADLVSFESCLKSSKEMKILLTSISHVGQTREYKDSLQSMKELADVLDRLEKHRHSGLLEKLTKI